MSSRPWARPAHRATTGRAAARRAATRRAVRARARGPRCRPSWAGGRAVGPRRRARAPARQLVPDASRHRSPHPGPRRPHDRPLHLHRPRAPLGGRVVAGVGALRAGASGPAAGHGLQAAARRAGRRPGRRDVGRSPARPGSWRAGAGRRAPCWRWVRATGRPARCSSPCVLFGLLMVMVETGRRDPRGWRCPCCGCGSNVHGSWPFALVYLVLRLVGRRLDGRDAGPAAPPGRARPCWAIVLAAANPQGPRLLAYPLALLTHHQAFAHVAEWQSPELLRPHKRRLPGRRGAGRRPRLRPPRHGRGRPCDLGVRRRRPAGVAQRAGGRPRGGARAGPGAGRTGLPRRGRGGDRCPPSPSWRWPALGAVLVTGALQRPAYDLSAYPVGEVTWMQQPRPRARGGWPRRTTSATTWSSATGPGRSAFVDDRVDMFPLPSSSDYETLLGRAQRLAGGPRPLPRPRRAVAPVRSPGRAAGQEPRLDGRGSATGTGWWPCPARAPRRRRRARALRAAPGRRAPHPDPLGRPSMYPRSGTSRASGPGAPRGLGHRSEDCGRSFSGPKDSPGRNHYM